MTAVNCFHCFTLFRKACLISWEKMTGNKQAQLFKIKAVIMFCQKTCVGLMQFLCWITIQFLFVSLHELSSCYLQYKLSGKYLSGTLIKDQLLLATSHIFTMLKKHKLKHTAAEQAARKTLLYLKSNEICWS